MENVRIQIKEATREEPIQTLEVTLMSMEGIERALVDIKNGEVTIDYNENEIAKEKIIQKIQQHGLHLH
ncbi:heavy-metal-associated domain-containing protein [Bacillus solitudinis]|uniref:heavy-metal-associated domain-containing protein n=1 Tax=Bacillus solitudinis TaxID=2014074 RepID=UPI000C230533|nr:heavy-metal-associated domain-containing protein [Bacillus solitudinis]